MRRASRESRRWRGAAARWRHANPRAACEPGHSPRRAVLPAGSRMRDGRVEGRGCRPGAPRGVLQRNASSARPALDAPGTRAVSGDSLQPRLRRRHRGRDRRDAHRRGRGATRPGVRGEGLRVLLSLPPRARPLTGGRPLHAGSPRVRGAGARQGGSSATSGSVAGDGAARRRPRGAGVPENGLPGRRHAPGAGGPLLRRSAHAAGGSARRDAAGGGHVRRGRRVLDPIGGGAARAARVGAPSPLSRPARAVAERFQYRGDLALAAEQTAPVYPPTAVLLYPPLGSTPREGHDGLYLAMDRWQPDVFAVPGDGRPGESADAHVSRMQARRGARGEVRSASRASDVRRSLRRERRVCGPARRCIPWS